ncbi:MAG: hypothetical protein O2817_10025 [Proteobacteria bacterium]|nr:hypothetical protein [Pseudomonadota bacterium]
MSELDDLRKRFSVLEWKTLEKVASINAREGDKAQEEWIVFLAKRGDASNRSEVAALRTAEEHGWDTDLIKRALIPLDQDGNVGGQVIEELAKKLWIEFGVHGVLKNKGDTHTRGKPVLPISLIRYLAVRLLESCQRVKAPRLIILSLLIRDLLNTEGYGHNKVRTVHQERVAALYLANNPEASNSKVAREVGVNKTTVSRWLKDASFLESVDHLKNDKLDRLWEAELLTTGLGFYED